MASFACIQSYLDVSGNREGERSRAVKAFKNSTERNKYTDFTFKCLSKLSNQLIRSLLDIRYGTELLCLCM